MFIQRHFNRLFAASAVTATMLMLTACGAAATPSAATSAPAATSISATVAEPTDVPVVTEAATQAATEAVTETVTEAATSATTETNPVTNTVAAPTKFNLNTVTAEQIKSVPNTGDRMVHEFEEYQPYTSILQFRKEIGKYVDEAQVAEYEQSFYVPVVPNEADAATLQQLPGVDTTIAEQLIAARPYASKDNFLTKLAELTSAEQAAAAAAYVEAA